MYFFLATELTPGPARPAADETIEVVRVPLTQVPELIRGGQIRDSKSVAGLLAVLAQKGLPSVEA